MSQVYVESWLISTNATVDVDDNKWPEGTITAARGDYVFEDLEVVVVMMEGSRYYMPLSQLPVTIVDLQRWMLQ